MKGRPVGIEYKGTDYSTIMLSFPLYYLDTADAKSFLKYVMKEKFSHPTDINDHRLSGHSDMLYNYPNPFTDRTTVSFHLEQATHVNLTVYNMRGATVANLLDKKLDRGTCSVDFISAHLPSGIYQLVMKTPDQVMVRKMVIIR